MRYLRYFALAFFGFIHHPEGWRLARKWDAEADDPRKRRVAVLDQLAHEVNKVRNGGYWRVSGYLVTTFRLPNGNKRIRQERPDTYRWTPR